MPKNNKYLFLPVNDSKLFFGEHQEIVIDQIQEKSLYTTCMGKKIKNPLDQLPKIKKIHVFACKLFIIVTRGILEIVIDHIQEKS